MEAGRVLWEPPIYSQKYNLDLLLAAEVEVGGSLVGLSPQPVWIRVDSMKIGLNSCACCWCL